MSFLCIPTRHHPFQPSLYKGCLSIPLPSSLSMGMLRISFPLWNSPLLNSTLSRPIVIIQFSDRLLILFTQCCISNPSLHQADPGFGWCFCPVSVWEGWKRLYFLLCVRDTSWFILMAGKEIFLWLPRAVESQSAAGTVIPQSEGILDAPKIF